MQLTIIDGETRIADIAALFSEYAASLPVDLSYQDFSHELAGLPGKYARPDGRLYLALADGVPAGCVAMRRLDESRAEMKRLYVRASFRGHALGRTLAERVIADARALGCKALLLDTLASMHRAQALYQSLGFANTEAYYDCPVVGTVFMRLEL